MFNQDRRREIREPCTLHIDVFLRERGGGEPVSPFFAGVLISFSRHGAGIALREVMAGRTHLIYGPQESSALELVLRLPVPGGGPALTLAVHPVWLRKEAADQLPPFRVGVEFVEPLPAEVYREANRLLREKTVARTGNDAV